MRQTTLHLDRAELRKPSPGPEHSGHGWESLENNPASCPFGQNDSSKPLYILKASVVSGGWDQGP